MHSNPPSIENIIDALHESWDGDTAFDASEWSTDNPARGQCVVSSLVVQNYLGGDLIRYKVHAPELEETHYCNRLPDGTILDTTGSQYQTPVTLEATPIDLNGFASARDKRLAETETRERYERLLSRVQQQLGQTALG